MELEKTWKNLGGYAEGRAKRPWGHGESHEEHDGPGAPREARGRGPEPRALSGGSADTSPIGLRLIVSVIFCRIRSNVGQSLTNLILALVEFVKLLKVVLVKFWSALGNNHWLLFQHVVGKNVKAYATRVQFSPYVLQPVIRNMFFLL